MRISDWSSDVCSSDLHIVAQRRVALAADAVGGIGAAQRHVLIDGDIIADLRGFADDNAEAMVDEQVAADRRSGMDVDPGQPARQMVDEAGEKEQDRKSTRLNSSH